MSVCLAAVALIMAMAGTAAAQQEAPLRLAFVNSDPSDGTDVYDEVAEVLEASNDLVLIEPTDLLVAGKTRGVSLSTFRDGDQRARRAAAFQQMIAASGAESILVLDVFGGGRTMQLVVIGPYGNEVDDIRQTISGSEPTQAESVAALKKVFKSLVPEVRSYRKQQAQNQQDQASIDLVGEENSGPKSIKDRVVAQHRHEHSDLHTGVTPTAGVMFGRRGLTLATQADYELDHASPFLGVTAQIDAILAVIEGDTGAFGATVTGSYAPFTTVFTDDDGQPVELPSTFSNAKVDLKYIKGLGPDLVLFGKGGAEFMAITIQKNEAYTGNSYLNLRAGAGILYKFGELAQLQIDAATLPTLNAELSGDTMGKADFSLGWNASAGLHLTFLEPLEIALGYDFQTYTVTYSDPQLADLNGQAATTTDLFHLANLTVGYGF